MAFNNLMRRASLLLGLSGQDQMKQCKSEEGEVIYCKNNVCVHPPVPIRTEAEHHPGYLAIRTQHSEALGSTLILSWIPNSSLKRNPQSLENRTPTNSPCRSSRSSTCPSPHRSPRHSLYSTQSSNTSPHISYGSERSVDELLDSISSKGCLQSFESEESSKHTLPSNQSIADSECFSEKHHGLSSGQETSNVQRDCGIEPEEVTIALEAMITKLNEVEPLRNFESVGKSYDIQMNDNDVIISATLHGNPLKNSYETLENSLNSKSVNRSKQMQPSSLMDQCKKSSSVYHSSRLKTDLKLNLSDSSNDNSSVSLTPNISVTKHTDLLESSNGTSSGTSTTSNCDSESCPPSPSQLDSYDSTPGYNTCMNLSSYYINGTPESLAMVHRLSFPEPTCHSQINTPSPSRKAYLCSYFSVDLGLMKSLRLFFSNKERTCGQLVIASRESQYKILHFHHGGLDKLAAVFEEWNFIIKPKGKGDRNCPYRQFSICQPEVSKEECHPEEGLYSVVDENVWRSYVNDQGQIEDEYQLRQAIFFGGLDSNIRHEAWPFLLHYYPFMSTTDEREQLRNDRYLEYQAIRNKRETMNGIEKEIFWRNIQCTVEKDVVRTDRSNPFFAGDDNPNVEAMRNILLNYAVYNPSMGYTQGMSDLLAPILTEVVDEADTFWCFVGLMQRTIFISSPKDNDMDKHLNFIRELIRLMVPPFYKHLVLIGDMELLFCHRWILLCFKREFPDWDALRMWEACWAHYQTDYFHLFICVAIIAIYSEDVIQQDMTADEMLLYFSSLAMHMNGDLVLRKARGLLHQFREMPRIPCTLHGLCEMCGPGMWDSGHVPVVECIGHEGQMSCPNGGECPSL